MKWNVTSPDGKVIPVEAESKDEAISKAKKSVDPKPRVDFKKGAANVGQFALPLLGTVGGGALGGLTSEVTGPVGPMAGAGLGAAGGQKLADMLSQRLGQPLPPAQKSLLGIPLPQNRYVQQGVLGAGGEGLGTVAMKAFQKVAPRVLRTTLDMPERDTQDAIKLGRKGLKRGKEFVKKGGYKRISSMLGMPSLKESLEKKIEGAPVSTSKAVQDIGGLIENLKNEMKLRPEKSAEFGKRIREIMKLLPDDPLITLDPGTGKPKLEALESAYRGLRDIVNEPKMLENVERGPLFGKLMKIRRRAGDLVNWQAPEGSVAKSYEKEVQSEAKTLYSKLNGLIEKVPKGKYLRKADELQRAGYLSEEFGRIFKNPFNRDTGGVKQLSLGAGPFIFGKATGLGYGPGYALAAASRSPILARELMLSPQPYASAISTLFQYRKLRNAKKKDNE